MPRFPQEKGLLGDDGYRLEIDFVGSDDSFPPSTPSPREIF